MAVCPECAQGKHVNCTGWVIDENDEVSDCRCPEVIHPWNRGRNDG